MNLKHPGVYIYEEFIQPSDVSISVIARSLNIGYDKFWRFCNGKTFLSVHDLIKLAVLFETNYEYFVLRQAEFEMDQVLSLHREEIEKTIPNFYDQDFKSKAIKTPETKDIKIKSKMLDQKAAAKYLGVNVKALYNWTSRGVFNVPRIKIGRKTLYSIKDLNEFIENKTI